MNLQFNTKLAENYTSNSQIARVLTESWVLNNSYCPSCGEAYLHKYDNNKPVADFLCNTCNEQYELKSKSGKLTKLISDGAYATMIERINSKENPNFFFLTYSKKLTVENFLIIPKQFFTTEIIVKRKELGPTAKRAGWVGCNIDISNVAEAGRVYLVKDEKVIDKKIVEIAFKKTLFLRDKSTDSKGWILDIMRCVDSIKENEFTLDEMYHFESHLKQKYSNNHFIKDKIRQQLQVLRDKGLLEFVGRGKYRKLKHEEI
jgi:type II restriction enzyme